MTPLALAALLLTPANDGTADRPRAAEACPEIFGSHEAREENAAYRKAHLHGVDFTEKRLEIVHSVGRWRRPKNMAMSGIKLVDVTVEDSGRPPLAIVEVGESLESLCKPGTYALATDDALGQSGQVLNVDARGVLVEQGGKLGFLPWDGHPPPQQVRIVWRSPYNVVMESSGGGGSKASKSASKKKPAKRKRSRRKRK